MSKPIPPEPRVPERDEVQMDMLGHNAFVVTMIGSVAFLVACCAVLF
jgi:hypothetical protein